MSFVKPEYRIRARDFSRGYVDTPEEDTIHPGCTPDAKNAFFTKIQLTSEGTRRALMSKRSGCALVNPTTIASSKKVDGLIEFPRENAAAELLAACNGTLYKFDGTDAFTALTGGTGFTAGRTARAAFSKNQAYICDGDKAVLYDGTNCRTPGIAKPTGVTNMTAVAPSGAGVTGTYEAKYTWYDQTHDHESSVTVSATAALSPAAQARRHTKPSGAPPSNVTHWRAYVRRTDTNETYYFRVATVAIATATVDEEVLDANRVDRAPTTTSNDEPPVFDLIGFYYGHAIGFKKDASDMYVSKQGDMESFDPADSFSVGKGDGKPVRSARNYGNEWVIQKPHKSFRLVGTRVPFIIEELHSSYGNVSQEAAVEVDNKLYAWDEIRGPYVTDTVKWESLSDNRIQAILDTVNRNHLSDIRGCHVERYNLIVWAVPTTAGSARKRTLLAYNYKLDAWLPPITGFEYGSLVQFTDTSGTLAAYFGDYWGRVYKLFDGERDGVPSGTVRATVTAATSSTVTADAATFYTTGSGLAGMPVAVRSPSGRWQWRRIQSNTATQITLDTTNDAAWTTTPDINLGTWTVVVGGIEWYWWTPWLDFGTPEQMKRGHWLEMHGRASSNNHELEISLRFNDDEGISESRDFNFPGGAAAWGSAVWGVSLWSSSQRRVQKKRISRSFFTMQLQFANHYPDEPMDIAFYQVTADALPRRRATSGAA